MAITYEQIVSMHNALISAGSAPIRTGDQSGYATFLMTGHYPLRPDTEHIAWLAVRMMETRPRTAPKPVSTPQQRIQLLPDFELEASGEMWR